MARPLTAGEALGRIWRIYRSWAPTLLLLGLAVFVPVDLINAATAHLDIGSIDLDDLRVIGAAAALAVLAITALLGEVFYTGAVAALLTRSEDQAPASLRRIAAEIRYGRIITVDLIYGALVGIGFLLLLAPGVAAFVWLALAAPLVEIEGRGVRSAFSRSVRLIRGRFWTVLTILLPIQLLGSVATTLAERLGDLLFGDSLFADWLAELLADLAVTPFYAVAAVVVTVALIREKEGSGPRIHSAAASA